MITLRQIQFALAVARHHHFKRAAEECNISQSALSLGIAEMEKILGVVIFERNNKQVVVTPLGEELLERAQKIYLDAQQLEQRARAGQGMLSFSMKLGFIPTIAPFLLPEALPLIRQKQPDFELDITEDQSSRLINAVQSGELDAAVLALPYDVGSLETMEFGDERFFVIFHKDHPLAAHKKITTNDLLDTHLLLLPEGHCLRDHILDVCKMHNLISTSNFQNASLNTVIELVANNMGVTLVPEIALPQMSRYKNVRIRPLDVPGPHRRLALITRNNYPRQQDLIILKDLFTHAVNTLKENA